MAKYRIETDQGTFEVETDEASTSAPSPEPTKLESGVRGAAQGASLGYADELTGLLESLVTDKTYKQARDESRANYKTAEEANPKTYLAGEVAAGVGAGIAVPGSVGIRGLAALGAAQGLGNSEADLLEGDVKGAVRDTAIGGTIGAGVGVAAKGAEKLLKAAPTPEALKTTANRAAFRATGGTIANAKELGDEGVQKLGRRALDSDLIGLNKDTDAMLAALDDLQGGAGKTIGDIRSLGDQLGGAPGVRDLVVKAEKTYGGKYASGLDSVDDRAYQRALEELYKLEKPIPAATPGEVVSTHMAGAADAPAGYNAARVTQEVGIPEYPVSGPPAGFTDIARKATEMNEFATRQGKLLQSGEPATDIANLISAENNAALRNVVGPEAAGRYDAALDTFGDSAQLRQLLEAKLAKETAGREGPGSVVRNVVQGVMDKYGNKGVALAADKLSEIVANNPQVLGKYAPVLTKAAARGAQSLSVTHFVLSQQDPEYRKLFQGDQQ